MQHRLRFGRFAFDPESLELRKDDRQLRIQEQPARVLAALLASPGTLITRDELRDRLWPSGTFVDFDNGLNTAINKLRTVLGDRAQAPLFIETVGRRGYRFIAAVERAGPPEPEMTTPPERRVDSTLPSRAGRLAIAGWIAVGLLLVVTLAAALASRLGMAAGSPRIRSQVVTALPGAETSPTLSPDGTQLAFVWQNDLYVQAVHAGGHIRIAERALTPAWSPDGQWIAFRRANANPDGSRSLMLITPQGQGAHEIAQLAPLAGGMGKHGFSWSKDGRQIALVGQIEPGTPTAVALLSVSTGRLERLTSPPVGQWDRFPAFSPNGTSIAFVRIVVEQSRQEVIVRDLSTGAERVVQTLTGGVPFDLGWLADGTALLVSIYLQDALTGLWRVPLDGGEKTPVDPSERASGFSVARLNSRVAYATWAEQCDLWETYPADRTHGDRSRKLPGSERYDWDVQVSPDNRHLAFASLRTRMNQIWVCDRDSTNCRQLTHCDWPCTTPRWSWDSTRLAYQQQERDDTRIHTIGLTGPPRRLAEGQMASWSRDGQWVYFSTERTGRREIWKVPSDGGPDVQVTNGGGGRVVETADGWLYFTAPVRSLYRMRVDGTGRELVHHPTPPLEWPLLRESAMFFDRPGQVYTRFDYQTKQLVEILRLPDGIPRCNGFDVAPDGAVVHVRARPEGDIVLLDPVR